jgi:hypothetical protein
MASRFTLQVLAARLGLSSARAETHHGKLSQQHKVQIRPNANGGRGKRMK